MLVPPTVSLGGRDVRVPLAQTRGERFDDLVLDAVEHLEERWSKQLEGVEFAVEDVPAVPSDGGDLGYDPDVVADETAGGARMADPREVARRGHLRVLRSPDS